MKSISKIVKKTLNESDIIIKANKDIQYYYDSTDNNL